MDHKPKLLDLVRNKIRLKHYSIRTEQAYVEWIKRFILFHDKRHPASMGAPEIRAFLSYLAVERKVAASTQTQALSGLIFLYREVLGRDVGWLGEVERAKKPERLPDVDFAYRQILVRDGKGQKDRVTMLPQALAETTQATFGKGSGPT